MPLTLERLREALSYDPATGIFRWKICRRGTAIGTRAGTVSRSDGYCYIGIDNRDYRAHRLAWLYVHGALPPFELDHKDLIRSHNWIDNLRPAKREQNAANAPAHRDNACGLKGVSFNKRWKHWRAEIMVEGRRFFLGCFDTKEAAHAAYAKAAAERCGEFARAA